MTSNTEYLKSRREFLFAYDIKMGNPNGDPDENRPRVLPSGTHYVTDVRLKRFIRDFLKSQGQEIMVDTVEGKTTNLTGRIAAYLEKVKKAKCQGTEVVDILLGAFIDARLFGSSLAFAKQGDWEPKPVPKTLTGAVQIQHGEVKHHAQEVDINGTSTFGSDEEKSQGTFTTYYGLRYALVAFHGIANEHSAKLSRMTDADYDLLLDAMWKGIRSMGNTRTKRGQVPRLLISITYKPGVEFQFGNLMDYIALTSAGEKPEKEWASTADYKMDLGLLLKRIAERSDKIESVGYCLSPDTTTVQALPSSWKDLQIDGPMSKVS